MNERCHAPRILASLAKGDRAGSTGILRGQMLQDEALAILQGFGVANARFLGCGKEGFVFTDGRRSYKVLREERAGITPRQLAFLRDRVGTGANPPQRILPLEDVWTNGSRTVLVSPLLDGEPYVGGHWWDLVDLLRECRTRRVALTNIHPCNLLVTPKGLVYVDLGASVEPLTDSLWTQMIRRAFLSFRWPTKDDLRELMTRCLSQDPPELDGVSLLFFDVDETEERKVVTSRSRPAGPVREVTLLIRSCSMEWRTIEFQVRHLVGQLEGPHRFQEILVVTDPGSGPFSRQYDTSDPAAHQAALIRLLNDGIIDKIVSVPLDPDSVAATARRWFGLETTNPHSSQGEPTHSSLYGFDQCHTDLVLQVDSDCLIGRPNPDYDYLGVMTRQLAGDATATTISLPVPLPEPQPISAGNGSAKWRVEVRCALLDLRRVTSLLPLPNRILRGQLELSWYRSLDAKLAQGPWQSYRGGDLGAFMVHVSNSRKNDWNDWYNIALAVERGLTDPNQLGKVDLVGTLGDWTGRRQEDLIFLVRGRNVPLHRLQRCIDSLLAQQDQDFGVIFIDAGSTNGMTEFLEELCSGELRGRATLYRNWIVASTMENEVAAVRELVDRQDSVVALLDADDALLGSHAVDRLREAYSQGSDLTVGSMMRTDRATDYTVVLENPRAHRGGTVWLHPRTFRRELFDRIRDEDLKVEGNWISYAEDWALMLPMVEMASHPVWIREQIYFYDPSPVPRPYSREEREQMIARICQKPAYLPARSG